MQYKAIFFDFDDTLGNREVYAYKCYRDILKENTQITDPILFEAILQDCMLWDEKGNINKKHVKDMLMQEYGIELPYDDFNTYWDSVLWKYCEPFQNSASTLEYLSDKYTLGLITNGPSDGQRNKLRQSGLEHFFSEDRITVSGDYAFKKPDPRLFYAACEKAHVQPQESVYVGDIYARDVLGSARAGMKPVWIWNQGSRICGTDTLVIHDIGEMKLYF